MAHWIITKDHLANKTVDIRSRGCPTDPASLKGWHQFRLYDDDGELYYTGFCSDCSSEAAFAPLDDFGMPDSGCTRIDYKNPKTGAWETL